MDASEKANPMCNSCRNAYNVFDKKPKLLPCLHNVCEQCYYSNKLKKDVLYCPLCKGVFTGEVDSQLDCVTVHEMVVKTLKDAGGLHEPCVTGSGKDLHNNYDNARDVSSDTVRDSRDTNCAGGNDCDVSGLERKQSQDDDDDDDSGKEKKSSWLDSLFHFKTKSGVDDSTLTNDASKDVFANTDSFSEVHQKDKFVNEESKSEGKPLSSDKTSVIKEISCSNVHHSNQAECYCPDCHLFMCSECQTNHIEDEAMKHHRCYRIADLAEISLSDLESNPHCVLHPDQALVYFCQNRACRKLACVKCATNVHSKHGKSSVEEANALERALLKELLRQTDEKLLQLEKNGKANEPETSVEASEDKMFQNLLEVTQTRKSELLSEVDTYYAHSDVIAGHLTDLLYTKCYCDMVLAYTTKSQLLRMSPVIQAHADDLLQRKIKIEKCPKEDLKFLNENLMNILQDIDILINGLSIDNKRKPKSAKGKRRTSEESFC